MNDVHDQLRVVIDPQRMQAHVVIPAGLDPAQLNPLGVEAAVAAAGVAHSRVIPGAAAELIASYSAARAESNGLLARGLPARHAEDGRIEMTPAIAEQLGDASRHALRPAVTPGQVIGRVVPMTNGEDGMDVMGQLVRAKVGCNRDPLVDESIMVARGEIIAQIPGLLKVADRMIRVHDSTELDRAGPELIAFPGSIKIVHGVADGAIVRVGGDLEVGGLVDAAIVEVGGNATLTRGMAARSIGRLKVGKDLTAQYLSNVEGAIGGNLSVHKELVGATLSVDGGCIAPRATIIGGQLMVGRSCEVGEIGCDASTPTSVVLGRLAAQERLLGQAVALLAESIGVGARSKEQLATLQSVAVRPTHDQAEQFTELMFVCEQDQARIGKLVKAVRALIACVRRNTESHLIVRGRLHAGARIYVGSDEVTVKHTMRGPVEIIADENGRTRVLDGASKSPISDTGAFWIVRSTTFCDIAAAEKAASEAAPTAAAIAA